MKICYVNQYTPSKPNAVCKPIIKFFLFCLRAQSCKISRIIGATLLKPKKVLKDRAIRYIFFCEKQKKDAATIAVARK